MDRKGAEADPGIGEVLPRAEESKKAGILSRSKDFLQGAVDSLTGKDLPKLVEDFTREMVIVAEGLSEDQGKLQDAVTLQGEMQDQAAEKVRSLEKQVSELNRRLDELVRRNERRQKGETGLVKILRQATWLAAVIALTVIVTALIRAFGK